MALNRVYENGDNLELAVTAAPGATVLSGDPCICGQIPGVALTDGDNTVANSGVATVQTNGVFDLAVVGETTSNAAIAVGDILYYDATKVNKDASNGVRFGYALEPVGSGDTTTIRVKVGY